MYDAGCNDCGRMKFFKNWILLELRCMLACLNNYVEGANLLIGSGELYYPFD